MKHPLINLAKAIVHIDNDLSVDAKIEKQHLYYSLERQLSYFRLMPAESIEGKRIIKYHYSDNNCTIGIHKLPEYGIFLTPSVIAEDGSASNTWKYAQILLESLKSEKEKTFDALLSITATSGDYMKFSQKGGYGKDTQKLSKEEASLSLIALTSPDKPSLQYRINKGVGKQPDLFNTCIIPDLPLVYLIDFVKLFKNMSIHKSASDIYYGNVNAIEKSKKIEYKPYRPKIMNGNFPNPPQSSALGNVALLGAIGEFAKESEYSELAKKVLESLKDSTLYMIKYGNAVPFNYNHYIIELAKQGNLREIIDSIFHSELYKNGKRNREDLTNQDKDDSINHYQKFDLFTARFLQLFNFSAFKDFLAFRAEYPHQVELLFNTYFIKMENIDIDIVKSARQLGKWLNLVAYITARAEIKVGSPNEREKLREQKAKVLIELESASFSAKTGDALVAQVITRAGRLSGMDVPQEADLFMEKAMSGELNLQQAQNLIIAFSRLKNAKESKEIPISNEEEVNKEEIGSNKDL